MNEGRAVINEGINLMKQKQAHDQLKIQLSDFFFFPPLLSLYCKNTSAAAPFQLSNELSSALRKT